MTDIRLRAFVSVAENGSFSAAARELFISQPAVSRHIRELESQYRTVLFDRSSAKVRLTPSGEVLLGQARTVLEAYRRLEAAMAALTDGEGGEIRIGASSTIAQYVLPEVVASYKKSHPSAVISLTSGNSREIESALLQGRIDIGLVEGIIHQEGLKYTPFLKDELVAIARAQNPTPETVTIADLRRIPVVLREFGSGTLDVVRRSLALHGVSLSDLKVEMNIGTTEGIKLYVRNSDALGFVSIRSVSTDVYRDIFKIVDIEGLTMERDFALVEREGESVGLSSLFKDFVLNYFRKSSRF